MINLENYKFSLTDISLVINSIIYIIIGILGGNLLIIPTSLLAQYGQWNRAILEFGAYWQLLSSIFIHANILHIAANMFFLWIYGKRAEELFTSYSFLIIYFVGGLLGSLLTLLLPLDTVAVGASGAIFSVLAAVLISLGRRYGKLKQNILVAALFFMFSITVGSNILAHLGGILGGALLGYYIPSKKM
jgi:rhomboid protease GluP